MLCDVEMFFFYCVGDHRDLHVMTHSFPTRRSSDLAVPLLDLLHLKARKAIGDLDPLARLAVLRRERTKQPAIFGQRHFDGTAKGDGADDRSEEHTSELQSLMRISYAVYCMENKNITNKTHKKTNRKQKNKYL